MKERPLLASSATISLLEGGRHTCRDVRARPWQHFCQHWHEVFAFS